MDYDYLYVYTKLQVNYSNSIARECMPYRQYEIAGALQFMCSKYKP